MKKRYKLLLGFLVTGIILVTIFFLTLDKKVYYLSLGDSLAAGQTPYKTIDKSYGDYLSEYIEDKNKLEFYTKKFSKSGYRSIDLLKDLEDNKTITKNGKKITIKNALIKADLVTLSIGANDLFYKLNPSTNFDLKLDDDIYTYIDESLLDVEKLLIELRKSCKEQIILLGFYNPFTNYSQELSMMVEPFILYANSKMEDLSHKYNMTFYNPHDTFAANPNYLPSSFEIHPEKEGYKAMSKAIVNLIDKKILAK